jgi:uncharacterized protein (TIGR00251 family)
MAPRGALLPRNANGRLVAGPNASFRRKAQVGLDVVVADSPEESGRRRQSITWRDHVCMAHVTISVRVQTRARKDELATVRDGVLVVRVTAPPLDGRANEALRQLLARLGVRASSVTIFRGHRSRDKLVRVVGVDQAAVDAALGV